MGRQNYAGQICSTHIVPQSPLRQAEPPHGRHTVVLAACKALTGCLRGINPQAAGGVIKGSAGKAYKIYETM